MSRVIARHTLTMAMLLSPAVAAAQQNDQPARGTQPARQGRPAADAPPAPEGGEFKSFDEKLSYVLGVNMARTMQKDGVTPPDPQVFSRGFIDTLTKDEPLLSDEEMTQVLQEFGQQYRAKAEAARKEVTAKWDADFAKKPAVAPKATESGIKYEVIAEGKGKKPKATDVVVVHYVGKLKDGKVFDSSIARGEPAVFPLNQVIKGWTEGLQLMPVGSKYRFQIPAALAYGEEGFGNAIPPNSDLTFEIELIEIAPPQAAAPAGDEPAEEEAPIGQPQE